MISMKPFNPDVNKQDILNAAFTFTATILFTFALYKNILWSGKHVEITALRKCTVTAPHIEFVSARIIVVRKYMEKFLWGYNDLVKHHSIISSCPWLMAAMHVTIMDINTAPEQMPLLLYFSFLFRHQPLLQMHPSWCLLTTYQ